MLRSKTPRAAVKVPKVGVPASSEPHWADIWLPRLSNLAQFGLFVFTLGFSYFTVLPLYQKAVLEEAVARKEIELAALNQSLEGSYTKLRAYAMRDFYIEAMPTCGGPFMERPSTSTQTEKTYAQKLFDVDVPSCLAKLATQVESLRGLSAHDRETFDSVLRRISGEIRLQRQRAIADYESAGSQVTEADWASLPRDSFRVRTQEFIEKLRGGQPDHAARKKILMDVAKERVGTEYENFIRERVVSLRKIEWGPKGG